MLKDERAGKLNLSSSILDVIYQIVHIFLAQLDVVLLAEIINCARNLGASSKFCGSGGAIVGIYKDENMYQRLELEMKTLRARVIKPIIFEKHPDEEGEHL